MSHYITTEGALYYLHLVVDSEAVVAQNGAQLTHDVGLVLPVVSDKHDSQVWSAWNVVGREWRKSILSSNIDFPNTTHSIHLKMKQKRCSDRLYNMQ